MNESAPSAKLAFSARGVVVGRHPAPDGKLLVLTLDHPPRELMPQNVGGFAVEVPRHQLAGAKAAGFDLHEQTPGRAGRYGSVFDNDLSPGVIASQFHGRKMYLTPRPASRSRKTAAPSLRSRSAVTRGERSNSGSSNQERAVRTALVPKWNGLISVISS